VIVLGVRRQPAHVRTVDAREPDIHPAAVGIVVGITHRERHPLAIRRHRRLPDALHREHVFDGEALGARGGCHEQAEDREMKLHGG
jgi:hypothetical protein